MRIVRPQGGKSLKILIVIPAYNEAENIVHVIEELKEVIPQCDYVIVNDGSSDNTVDICRKHGYHFLMLSSNLGLAGAVQTGMRYAYEKGYDAAIQFDGDGQHDPRYISKMIERMEETNADLVIASRFVDEPRPRSMRMVGNAIIESAIRITTGKRVSDPTSGMRLYRRNLLKHMAYEVNYGPEPDTVAYLLRCGAHMEELQVKMRERTAGESYLSFGRSIRYMTQMCTNIFFIQWVRKRRDLTCPGQ